MRSIEDLIILPSVQSVPRRAPVPLRVATFFNGFHLTESSTTHSSSAEVVQSNFGPSPSVLCIILANGAASIHRLRKIEQLRQSVSGMLEHGGYDKMI